MRILGAVLAGGESRRFGSDKAEALLDGKRLIDHAAASIAPFCETVVIAGRTGGVPDRPAPGLGPLGGLCGALAYGAEQGFEAVLTTACDVPELPEALMRVLIAAPPAVIESLPVVGVWPTSLGVRLAAYLESGAPRAMRAWCETAGAQMVAWPQAIRNINRLEDMAQPARLPGAGRGP
ncbi:molybdenum cofactor guanylyltransferase [Sphingosinicella soli]|uniref:Molybdenum cofactor guanylyltransferase n=1 Tax=Sphingosinicella soli TaxID=333708 RepID=A0A7W7AY71_9SPHN|nr:NTP transferase domain-containing protein [Sphingosinicella soli]MBB4630571.1 molybdopterin-guanine dinucleotide biosynthesis protein A [Sphingosinicella soli]